MQAAVLDLFNSCDITPFTPVIKHLPEFFKTYDYSVKATFNMMSLSKEVNRSYFPELFGIIRERFGALIPNFGNEIGEKYLLKTVHAHYSFFDDFVFSEKINSKMYVFDVNSRSYSLLCLFREKRRIKAMASQKIYYIPVNGSDSRIPENMRNFIAAFDSKKYFKSEIKNYLKERADYGRNLTLRESRQLVKGDLPFKERFSFQMDEIPKSFMTPERNMSQSKFAVILNDILDKNLDYKYSLKEFNIHYLKDFVYGERLAVDVYLRDKSSRYNIWAVFHGNDGKESIKTIILANLE